MKTSRKKNFFEQIFRFFFIGLISLSTIFGNVKNVQAESQLKVNFPKKSIVEHLKLDVPKKYKHAWLKAEHESWEPWLLKQNGFLGRQLFWDPNVEESTLLIGWESRALWKNISQTDINLVKRILKRLPEGKQAKLVEILFH